MFQTPIFLNQTGRIKPIIPTHAMAQWGMASFGADNTYPDYVKSVVARSPTATTCYETAKRWAYGLGFADERTANTIIAPPKDYYSKPLTMAMWLEKVISDAILYGGHTPMVQLDKSGREIVNIYLTEFTQWRKGYKGSGKEDTAWRWDNWAGENPRGAIVNPTPDAFEQYKLFGSKIEYDADGFPRPQLFYLQNECIGASIYPNAPYNGALPLIDMEGATGRAMNNRIQNGFHAAYFASVGADMTPDGQAEMEETLSSMQGVDALGGVVFTTATGAAITPMRDASSDGSYKKDLAVAQRYIAGAFNVPTQLLPFERASSLGNSQEMKTAVALMQAYADSLRKKATEWISEVLQYASPDIYGGLNLEITPLTIEIP